MAPDAKTRIVKDLAGSVGFDRVGVTHAGRVHGAANYRRWLDCGYAGSMRYLARNVPERLEPVRLLSGARSIICVALNYRRLDDTSSAAPKTADKSPLGRIARYARGKDYHQVLHCMLHEFVERLRQELNEPFESRVFVDTGPLLERELARAAGLGWIGKNTLLMHRQLGSYLFLGEAITTLELTPDTPVTDHCGTCTRCLDACPTGALIAPYQLDAARCISYFTIEHRGAVPAVFHERIGDRVFGCDVCQEVCPFNAHAPLATHPEITQDRLPPRLSLLELLNLSSGDYRRLTRDSATRRATRRMWQRNAAIALANAAHAAGSARWPG